MNPRTECHFEAPAALPQVTAARGPAVPAHFPSFILSDLDGLMRLQQLLSALRPVRSVRNREWGVGIRTAVRYPDGVRRTEPQVTR
jgi:hypothetical protein